ncbi:MAG: TRAP transporter large permease subunit [Candidatus Atribacteria bacterium]|nr:MAG: TRAP transporter large permease subunit [Candidatus Atribacteria bacterium]
MLQQVLFPLIILISIFLIGLIFFRRLSLGLLLIISGIAASLTANMGIPLRHIVQGTFVYFNVILIVITGMVFLQVLEDSGSVATISKSLVLRLYRHPKWLLLTIVILLLIPGMLTGVAVTSVLSIGILIAPILMSIGIPPVNTAAIIAIVSALSMVAPPTNLLGMIMALGINAPYEGFELPSFILSVPLAIILSLFLGSSYAKITDKQVILAALPKIKQNISTFMAWLPLLVVIGLIAIIRMFPKLIPDLGTPLVFSIGAIIGLFTAGKVNLLNAAKKALSGPMLTVIDILVGAGIFVQLITLVGIRGLLVVSSLSLPHFLAYLAAAVSLVLGSGFLSPFGSTSIFGVPFALFFLGKNQIVVITALSLMAAVGQLSPPAAIAGRFSAQICKVKNYSAVLKKSILGIIILLIIAILVIIFSEQFALIISSIREIY